jgi:hypothetical protein
VRGPAAAAAARRPARQLSGAGAGPLPFCCLTLAPQASSRIQGEIASARKCALAGRVEACPRDSAVETLPLPWPEEQRPDPQLLEQSPLGEREMNGGESKAVLSWSTAMRYPHVAWER